MKIYIETSRLILRAWKKEDIPVFVHMNRDKRVMEYFLKKLTEQETLDFYDRICKEFTEYGYGLYAVELKENHTFIGYVGFHRVAFDVDSAPAVEIGWRLVPEAWGKGIASEAASACLEYARKTLKFKEVCSFTSLPNHRSERVMQKIGMLKVKEFDHPLVEVGHPLRRHVLYKAVFSNNDSFV